MHRKLQKTLFICASFPPLRRHLLEKNLWRTESSYWVSPDLFQIVISYPKLIQYTSEHSFCLTRALLFLFCRFLAASTSSADLKQLIHLLLAPKYTQQVTAFIDFPFSTIHKELRSLIVMSSPTTGALISYDYTHALSSVSPMPGNRWFLTPITHNPSSYLPAALRNPKNKNGMPHKKSIISLHRIGDAQ